jgi:RimJ/RimL family protein N-acetyltransferase
MATFGPETVTLKNGRNVTFRHCTAQDGKAFPSFQKQIARETRFTTQLESRAPDPVRAGEAYVKSEKDPFELRVGVFDAGGSNDRMIGQIGFHPENPTHPWIKHTAKFGMMVLQEFWGNGIGRRLLEIMHEHAHAIGISRIEATVRTRNERGLKLYRSMGYEIEGTRRAAALIEGEYVDEYYIGRVVRPDTLS